ncbi:MAG: hypothetical protein LUC34_01225 [Campylobacter sp.]|nr:hypothetical protein [Campylobacter sp.]
MDLKEFDISQGETGVELTILDLENNPTDIKIKVLSFHSKRGREVFINAVKAGDKAQNPSHILAGLTLDWSGLSENGKEVKFSRDEAIRVYDKYPIIANQVERFVEDARNFLKK